MIYFTADTHFGHANILKLCDRPFDHIQEMNESLIAKWNSRVNGNDTVYIVGDLFFRCNDAEAILKHLRGKKRLIVGNHEGSWLGKVNASKYFASVDNFLEISDGQHALTLCHYPLLTWNHAKKSYMIHGHIHIDTSSDYWPLLRVRERVLNAGTDINSFQPVTFDELMENNRQWKATHEGEEKEL